MDGAERQETLIDERKPSSTVPSFTAFRSSMRIKPPELAQRTGEPLLGFIRLQQGGRGREYAPNDNADCP